MNFKCDNSGLQQKQDTVKMPKVTLNVGGVKYVTTTDTLINVSEYFRSLFSEDPLDSSESSNSVYINFNDEVFIDRDGNLFQYILKFARKCKDCRLPDNNDILNDLLDEVSFFGMSDSFKDVIEDRIEKDNENDQEISTFFSDSTVNLCLHIARESRGTFYTEKNILHCLNIPTMKTKVQKDIKNNILCRLYIVESYRNQIYLLIYDNQFDGNEKINVYVIISNNIYMRVREDKTVEELISDICKDFNDIYWDYTKLYYNQNTLHRVYKNFDIIKMK